MVAVMPLLLLFLLCATGMSFKYVCSGTFTAGLNGYLYATVTFLNSFQSGATAEHPTVLS